MRSMVTFATVVLASASALACDIGPQTNVKLDPKDRAVLISLGKAINAQELLKGTPVAALFSEPSGVLTLNTSDAKTLAKALGGLRKSTACYADRVTMERILEDDTPGIRFLKQIEGCLADACVDNQ
ncbi:hypothetical protein [Reyranella soli]|jgi:hypothetical protein|uniref:Lipoprotein n=1 Tax=Reyranella soli TaxID=1230389 RepID=A0A512NQE8_9HYPH|nr:hypothetical protein [Reyranella soli]GEP61157.1 hypothetical protein RSO01_83230 [Reyranella soli]